MKLYHIVVILILLLIFLIVRDNNKINKENLGMGGISIRGAVYPPYPGDPYGFDYSIMPDCLNNCCDREACDKQLGCRWNSGGKNYTGLVQSCVDHKKCIKNGGNEEQCKEESNSSLLV